MDALWSIILTLVCVAIGLLSERKKKTHSQKAASIAPKRPVTARFNTPVPAPQPLTVGSPLPKEGEHIVLPTPTADELNSLKRKKQRNQALKHHYAYWRQAVATQTILNRNNSY